MTSSPKIQSVRRLLLDGMVGIVFLVLIISLSIVTSIVIDHDTERLEQDSRSWANLLAKQSITSIQSNDKNAHSLLKQHFKQVIIAPFINYIHVYKTKDNGTIEFYTSYNKNRQYPPIANKIDHIDLLSNTHYHNGILEFIIKLRENGQVYGYLYLQANLNYIHKFIQKVIYVSFTLIIVFIIFTVLVGIRLYRKYNLSLQQVNASIQEIAHHKDFSQRLSPQPYSESDILSKNINILLTRVEKHIVNMDETFEQTLQNNSELKDKLNLRTSALKESNQDLLSTLEKLHQFQGQLVENEKMASLGDMVAGVAHEINTPLGLGITASTVLYDNLEKISQAFENKTLKSSQLKKFLADGQENLAIVYRNLERAANLTASFKLLAVDQSKTEITVFTIKGLLDEVILTLKPELNQEKVSIIIDCPKELTLCNKPEPINQIFHNLILNAIVHGFENMPHGTIDICITQLNDNLHINFSDNGIGIPDEIKTKMFDPFTTTKRGLGGGGLGLHLVYNLVTQALNGQISVESELNHGVSFNITFPIKAQ
ncbi:MAG: HAMP domain-containing histidine kinase [Colwellia sp.]